MDQVMLAAPVRVEILSGSSKRDYSRLRILLSALPLLLPTENSWAVMETWVQEAVRAGQCFGIGDLLIGAIAAENKIPIWSLDSDFSRMAAFGWLQLHRLPI